MGSYVQERGRQFHYRRRVPDDVKQVVGQREWVHALKATTRRQAEELARTLATQHDTIIRGIRALPEVEKAKVALTHAESKWMKAILTTNRLQRATTPELERATARRARAFDVLTSTRNEVVKDGDATASAMSIADVQIDVVRDRLSLLKMARDGIVHTSLTEGQRAVLRAQVDSDRPDAFLDAYTARQLVEAISSDEQYITDYETRLRDDCKVAKQLGVVRKVVNTPEDPENPTILGALEQFLVKEKQTHDTARKYRVYIRRLVETTGDIQIAKLRKRDVIKFIDEVEKLPDSRKLDDALRNLPMAEIIKRRNAWLDTNPDADPDEWPLITAKTAGKHLDAVKALCGWSASRDDDVTNVARELKPPKDRREKDDYAVRAFTADELQSILAAAIDLWGEHDEMTWLIRMATMTGARLEELSQLARDNIVGGDTIVIDTGKFVEDGQMFRRKLKNEPSKRRIPVHSALLDAGFADFAKGDSVRLFPSFKRSAGRYGHNPSKAFGRLLRDRLQLADKRVRFHSFRHTMITALHTASVHPVHVNAIVGHERAKGPAGGYIDSIDVEVLRASIEKVPSLIGC